MFVSEIDPLNYRMAMKNVEQNGLEDRIHGKRNRLFFLKKTKELIFSNPNGSNSFI
jgi:tRNA1(Val) A37 N6-methylase TrmN6